MKQGHISARSPLKNRGVELDILSHTAELVSVFEFHADIAALVNLDMVDIMVS